MLGREWQLELGVPSPAEAVRALRAVCEGFGNYLVEQSTPGFHVVVGERDVGAGELDVATGARITILRPWPARRRSCCRRCRAPSSPRMAAGPSAV
ncbi:hypothetical protein LZ198_42230 [Myxococcus sp. K15C18031901]|uniref:hypothetical protein n=1 Tax=Myxococcus dinghuensis TaxID=2906761 RepID=UPI0020A7E371|nr:hypothetical protein [Myxococcus dinghuensis]MCP3105496.1 hypothetical protein [Myxococcus dinghuensis]